MFDYLDMNMFLFLIFQLKIIIIIIIIKHNFSMLNTFRFFSSSYLIICRN